MSSPVLAARPRPGGRPPPPEGRRRRLAWGAALLVGLVAGLAVFAVLFRSEDPIRVRPLAVGRVHDTRVLSAPPSVQGRDGAETVLVGHRVLWMFNDTVMRVPNVDGAKLLSNTAALATKRRPEQLSEPLDANGVPKPFLSLTAGEGAYDAANAPSRSALWPMSGVTTDDGHGLVYYLDLRVHPGWLNFEAVGSGIARVRPGATTGTRGRRLLFVPPEPTYYDGALRVGDDVYVYDCKQTCTVARAPLHSIATRSAYRFWDGHRWSRDITRAVGVLRGLESAKPMLWSGISVAWNPYLGRYLAVFSGAFGFDSGVYAATAPDPTGPWRRPVKLFDGVPPAVGSDYTAHQHPELSRSGRTLHISYYHPLAETAGEVRLVSVGLR